MTGTADEYEYETCETWMADMATPLVGRVDDPEVARSSVDVVHGLLVEDLPSIFLVPGPEVTREERPRRTALLDRTRAVLRAEERLQITGEVAITGDERFDVVVCHRVVILHRG